jgi:hypothetical protein
LKDIFINKFAIILKGGDNMPQWSLSDIETINIPNTVSYVVDTQYDCYIKSQTISNEEKLAVKKFIEFMRRNLNEIRDTEHCQEIKQQERNDVIE